MINFFLVPCVLTRASNSDQNWMINGCSGQFLLDYPFSFNFTVTHSQSLVLNIPPQPTKPPVVPIPTTATVDLELVPSDIFLEIPQLDVNPHRQVLEAELRDENFQNAQHI